MVAIGAKIRWRSGDILHPASMWQSPSRRRLPRLLIENRALEVVLLVYIEDKWLIFHETNFSPEKMETNDIIQLKLYLNRFYLLPEKLKRQDAYDWLRKPENAILLWGQGNKYFVSPVEKNKYI